MFRIEGTSSSTERKGKHIKMFLFFTLAMLGISACAPKVSSTQSEADLDLQRMKLISTPIPKGPRELQTITILQNSGCVVPNNIEYVHANGPVASQNSDGSTVEVRGLFTTLQREGIKVPTALMSETGLNLGYEEYNKTTNVKISKETYVTIQYLLTLLHESIHSCTGDVQVNETPIFDFFDEKHKISASLAPKENANSTAIDLVLLEEKLGTNNVTRQVIDLEEVLTHGLTHVLIKDSGLFEDPDLASEINLQSSLYRKGIQFFAHILKPGDIQTILSMKSSKNTQGIYTLLYQRFTENVTNTLASFNLTIPEKREDTISVNEYLFSKFFIEISSQNYPFQEQEITNTLAQLIYNKELEDLSGEEMNVIQTVIFNLFRA